MSGMVKALDGAFAHSFELRLKGRKLLASHGDVGFGAACHIRLVFAILAFGGRGRFHADPQDGLKGGNGPK
jgi:hypothetical protein